MNIQLLLILIFILGIVPNLGFFTFGSFFLFVLFGIIAWIILRNPISVKGIANSNQWGILLIYVISAYYYGGYYQNPSTQLIGQIVFFSFCIYIFMQLYRKKEIPSWVFVILFLFLSLLTMFGSPNPTVDTFVIIKEAPQKLLMGQNPYNSMYSKVYKDITPNYFSYLPFSIIYFLPFVFFLGDPRFGLVAAMLGTYFIASKMQKKHTSQKYLFSSLFLFAPRSFYMIEHAYLDTLIFFLFVLIFYFSEKKKNKVFSFLLSCFFLVKQNMVILFPLFIKKLFKQKSNILLFLIPFVFAFLFYLWNPPSFIRNIVTTYEPNQFLKSVPLQSKIVVPNMISLIFHPSNFYMQLIITLCSLTTLFIAAIIMLNKKITLTRKIILILFFGYFFSYHAYFNSYYLVLLFLLFDFMLSKDETLQTN